MTTIFVVEIVNFFIGLAIFVTGYVASAKFFKDDATVLKKGKFEIFFNAIRWAGFAFLFLALHEFVIIVSNLNVLSFGLTIPYLVSEGLFAIAVVGSALNFKSAISNPAAYAVD